MAIRHIARKDLLILTRDMRALVILFVMPLVFIAILGFSTGQLIAAQNDAALIRLVLVDQCKDELVPLIAESIRKCEGLKLSTADSVETAFELVDDGEVTAAVIVGPEFRRRVDELGISDLIDPSRGRLAKGLQSVDLQIYARPTRTVARAITEQLVLASVFRALAPHIARRNPLADKLLSIHAASASDTTPASPVVRLDEGREAAPDKSTSIVYQIIVPGYTVMFAFFLINIMARSFINERNEGTLLRLHASPISKGQLLLGKSIPFLIISIVQGVLLFTFGKLLFGMSWGSLPWLLFLVVACTSVAATALGLLTAVLVKTDAQVSAYANLVVITLAGVSGCFMPREWLPDIMRKLSLATPHAWSLIAYDQILVSARPNVGKIMICCGVLVSFGLGFSLISWLKYRPGLAD